MGLFAFSTFAIAHDCRRWGIHPGGLVAGLLAALLLRSQEEEPVYLPPAEPEVIVTGKEYRRWALPYAWCVSVAVDGQPGEVCWNPNRRACYDAAVVRDVLSRSVYSYQSGKYVDCR